MGEFVVSRALNLRLMYVFMVSRWKFLWSRAKREQKTRLTQKTHLRALFFLLACASFDVVVNTFGVNAAYICVGLYLCGL